MSGEPAWLSEHGSTLLAIVNLNRDSFSDPRTGRDPHDAIEAAGMAIRHGAAAVDLGAQSAALAAQTVPAREQIRLLDPVVSRLAADGVVVSVDTYHPEVAQAVLAAGATILNDFSGAAEPAVVEAAAQADAWYVLTHNPVGPRRRQTNPGYYADVVVDVIAWFAERVAGLSSLGLRADRVILDPGIDVAKTPAQTLDLLRGLPRIRRELPQPQLLAISRKDVLGALTGRLPGDRDAATLALLESVADQARTLVRVHDIKGAADYLRVRAALRGDVQLDPSTQIDDELRRQAPSG